MCNISNPVKVKHLAWLVYESPFYGNRRGTMLRRSIQSTYPPLTSILESMEAVGWDSYQYHYRFCLGFVSICLFHLQTPEKIPYIMVSET